MDSANTRQEINKYKKFKKVDGATYRKVNQFLRKRTYITAREWALARLCTDFRTSGGAEMTFIGNHLPDLVPFMEDTYTPQAVNQARNSFKKKVRKSSATFFYGAMCGFFTTDELDDLLFEASEVARFLLEIEGTTLDIDEEIDIEDRITQVMRSVGEAAKTILHTRAEETGAGNIPHNGGSETPKKMSDLIETDISSKQKIKRKNKNTDRVSAKNPPNGFEHPETVEIIPMVTETSAIHEVISIVKTSSNASPAIIKIGGIISHIPKNPIAVSDKNERNEQYISANKDELEIAGDKTP
jgi:hypothetical protein